MRSNAFCFRPTQQEIRIQSIVLDRSGVGGALFRDDVIDITNGKFLFWERTVRFLGIIRYDFFNSITLG